MRMRSVSAVHSRWDNVRAISIPAASSERSMFPIPTTATRGTLCDSVASCLSRSFSGRCQVFGNVFLFSIINQKVLIQRCVLPVLAGHGEAIHLAADHTLPAVDAAILAI